MSEVNQITLTPLINDPIDYIHKPFQQADLQYVLNKYLSAKEGK